MRPQCWRLLPSEREHANWVKFACVKRAMGERKTRPWFGRVFLTYSPPCAMLGRERKQKCAHSVGDYLLSPLRSTIGSRGLDCRIRNGNGYIPSD